MTENFNLAKAIGASARRQIRTRNWPVEIVSMGAAMAAAFYYKPAGVLAMIAVIWGTMWAAHVLASWFLPSGEEWFNPPRASKAEGETSPAIVAGLAWAIMWRTVWVYLLLAIPAALLLGWVDVVRDEFPGHGAFKISLVNAVIGFFALVIATRVALGESYRGFRFTLVRDDRN
jgi:hypothetical protein